MPTRNQFMLYAGLLLLVGSLGACRQARPVPGGWAAITIRAEAVGQRSQTLEPQGIPTDPITGAPADVNVELFVTRGGLPVRFDDALNVTDGPGVPVLLTAGSVTLMLPYGRYDFRVEARDALNTLLADGAETDRDVEADFSTTIRLTSFLASATLTGPHSVVPNQVIDVMLAVHPPGSSELLVPTVDFSVEYSSSAQLADRSNRGVRLVVECQPISVEAAVTDLRGTAPIAASLNLAAAEVCETYDVGTGVDLIPPYLTIVTAPTEVGIGSELVLAGAVTDAQTGVATVTVYDGPVPLGNATIDESNVENLWEFRFTPDTARPYHLTILATDNAGNETRMALSLDAPSLRLASVKAGGRHTCGLSADGTAFCWGRGQAGQLGNGDSHDTPTPAAVQGGRKFTQLALGANHTCGLAVDGTAYCWGYGGSGQLGNGDTTSSNVPIAVAGHAFTALSSGESHTCGLAVDGGTYCWGYGANGQLGQGALNDSSTPALASGGLAFVVLSAGGNHTCGLLASGAAYCWGRGGSGELGNGYVTTDRPVPTVVGGSIAFTDIAAGYYHTCAVTASGSAYCWGDGGQGRLGYGGTSNSYYPTLVPGSAFSLVSTGLSHTCALSAGGTAYCWGSGSNGQVGNGSNAATNLSPSPVLGHGFTSVTAGQEHTCGITAVGEAYCWGRGDSGQLGDGTGTNANSPTIVSTTGLP